MSTLAFPKPPTVVSYPISVANGGTGSSTALAARSALALLHASAGVDVLEVIAAPIGGNYRVVGWSDQPGSARASVGRVRRGRRAHARHTPAALTDGSVIGGFNAEINNKILRCDATNCPEWAVYHFFATDAAAAIRGAAIVGDNSPADTAATANNSVGVVRRAGNFLGYATDNAGAQTTGDLGVAPAANTAYVAEILWTGGSVKVRIATVDTDGVWGTWSTQATISANLPSSTLGLAPAQKWWVVGTPASATVDVGGAVGLPYAT